MHMDDILDLLSFKSEFLRDMDGWLNPDESLIVDPDGKMWTGRQWKRNPSCMQRLPKANGLDLEGSWILPVTMRVSMFSNFGSADHPSP